MESSNESSHPQVAVEAQWELGLPGTAQNKRSQISNKLTGQPDILLTPTIIMLTKPAKSDLNKI